MELARRRLRVARYSIGAVTLGAFAAFGFAVRDAHPATHAGTPSSTGSSSIPASQSSTTFDYGGSAAISPAPAQTAPTIQSDGS
jgi:hypothetical protein